MNKCRYSNDLLQLLFGVSNFLMVLNPATASGMLLSTDSLMALVDILRGWEEELMMMGKMRTRMTGKDLHAVEISTKREEEEEEETAEELIMRGMDICSLCDRIVDVISPFLLCGYAYMVAGGTAFAYGGCGLIYPHQDEESSSVVTPATLVASAHLSFASSFLVCLWMTASSAQLLARRRQGAEWALAQLALNTQDETIR